MLDDDQLTDSNELRALRDSLTGIAMPGRPPLGELRPRGRAHRRHRRSAVAGVLAAGVVACAALAVGVGGVLGSGAGHGSTRPVAAGRIRTAAYTLVSYTNGTVTLTINPKELFDAAALQSDLARDGIPARVTTSSFCSSDPAPAGFSEVVSMQPSGQSTLEEPVAQPTMTFHPAAMPAGTELSFGNFDLSTGGQQADLALIDTSSYGCTSVPADAWSAGELGVLYGGQTGS